MANVFASWTLLVRDAQGSVETGSGQGSAWARGTGTRLSIGVSEGFRGSGKAQQGLAQSGHSSALASNTLEHRGTTR